MSFVPASDQPLPPTTTTQQDLTTFGQRRINLIWEFTQAAIAILLVGGVVIKALRGQDIPGIMSTLVGMVVGSYFQRTNHQNIGGIGAKETDRERYIGR